ncbi:MAG: hypothetical protein ACO1QB_03400 [Verrucomicrobiales bacterium]
MCAALVGCGGGGGGDGGGGGGAPPPDSQPGAEVNSGPNLAPAYLARRTLQLNNSGSGIRILRFDPNGTTWQNVSNGAAAGSGTYQYQKNGAGQNAVVVLNETSGSVSFRLTFQTETTGFYTYLTGQSGSASFSLSGIDGNSTGGTTSGNSTGNTTGATDGGADGSTNGSTNGSTDGSTDGATNGATNGGSDGTTNGSTDGSTNGDTTGSTTGTTGGESLSGLTMRATRTYTSTGPVGQTHTYTFSGSTFHDSDPPEESDGDYTYITTGVNSATLQLRYSSPEEFAGDLHDMNMQFTTPQDGTFTSTYQRHDGTNIEINGTFTLLGR